MKRIALASALLLSVCVLGITSCSADIEESSSVNSNGEVLGESRVSVTTPDNPAFDGEPTIWNNYADGLSVAYPPCFLQDLYGPDGISVSRYYSYELDEDTKIWMYVSEGNWTNEMPYYMDSETFTQSLEDVPGFTSIRVTDTFLGPAFINGQNPFNIDNTEFTIDEEQCVDIGERQFIRQEGSARVSDNSDANTVYFTIYYGLDTHAAPGGDIVEYPFFLIVVTSNGSAEARQFLNDSADYAMTYCK